MKEVIIMKILSHGHNICISLLQENIAIWDIEVIIERYCKFLLCNGVWVEPLQQASAVCIMLTKLGLNEYGNAAVKLCYGLKKRSVKFSVHYGQFGFFTSLAPVFHLQPVYDSYLVDSMLCLLIFK